MSQSDKKRITKKDLWIAAIIAILLVAAGLMRGGYLVKQQRAAKGQAQDVLDTMKTLIPGLGTETGGSGTMGREPLASLSVHENDIVGCLEIPSLDLTAPVLAKGSKKQYFVTWKSGSPVKGKFRLRGGHKDIFADLAKAKPGDKVIFTDIDGVRYAYDVTTQYHLKSWAKADNDLLLCYKVDENTEFVLGCTYAD